MTWVRLDDAFFTNSKAIAAGLHGRSLALAGICYASGNLTDGKIAKAALPIIAAMAGVKPNVARQVVVAGLWEEEGDHYLIHDYLKYNPSAEQVHRERDAAAERQRRWRDTHVAQRRSDSDRNGVSSASPSHPIPDSDSLSVSSRGLSPPSDDDDNDNLNELWLELARRRADLEHPDGHGINNQAKYLNTLVNDHKIRLGDTASALHAEHPHWTVGQLADVLDPDTAPRNPQLPDPAESAAFLESMRENAKKSVPIPDELRAQIGARKRARTTHK
jgi:hypothetical protein